MSPQYSASGPNGTCRGRVEIKNGIFEKLWQTAVKLKRQIIGRLRGSQPLLSHKCFSRALFIFDPACSRKNHIDSSLSVLLALRAF